METFNDVAMKQPIEQLYEEYHKNRNIHLTFDQFTYICNLFPAMVVCMSDGKLDKEEWEGVLKITDSLAEAYSLEDESVPAEEISRIFRTELRYLLDNMDKWSKKFLNTLKDYVKDSKSDKEFIVETMYLFANVADGISQDEQEAIDELSERLALEF
ncbi:MAG: hypothetical protein NXI20_23185 [bacterium]|nr:hypothetical protein [bacterium]